MRGGRLTRAEGVPAARSLFQAGGGGSTPTSALQFWVHQVMPATAVQLNGLWHSRLPRIGDPLSVLYAGLHYAATFEDVHYAIGMWTHPVNRSLPQVTWLELRRMAVCKIAPRNTPSRFLAVMTRLIRKARPGVVRLISYQDTEVHNGAIYRAGGWEPDGPPTDWAKWDTPSRRRPASQSDAPKQRWRKILNGDATP